MKQSGLNISVLNLFYLFFCIIWEPFHIFYFRMDGAGRTIMLLSIIALLANISTFMKRKDLFRSPAFICWTLLTLFSLTNAIYKGIITEQSVMYFMNFNFLTPYTFLLVAIVELGKDKTIALKVLFYAFVSYLLMSYSSITVLQSNRFLSEEIGNMFPLTCVALSFIVSILVIERKLKGGWVTYGFIIAILTFFIVVSGTRKALGGFAFVVMGVILGNMKKVDLKSILTLLIAAVVLYEGLGWIMDNTFMGERFAAEGAERYDVPLSSNPVINSFLMSFLGDRAWQYFYGMELFYQNPISGIGLNHFASAAQYDFRLHSEYMVQLCENGIIGFSLLILFYWFIIRGLKKRRKNGSNVLMYYFGLFTILFLNFTAWTYNVPFIMAFYAILINEAYSKHQVIMVSARTKVISSN